MQQLKYKHVERMCTLKNVKYVPITCLLHPHS